MFLLPQPLSQQSADFRGADRGMFRGAFAITIDRPTAVEPVNESEPHGLAVAAFERNADVGFLSGHFLGTIVTQVLNFPTDCGKGKNLNAAQ